MRDLKRPLPDQSGKDFGHAPRATAPHSKWQRIACAIGGHPLEPAMPEAPLRCQRCSRYWTWEDLFLRPIPARRRRSQRAYDDKYWVQTADVPAQYL
jgi:hypothetical protein